MKMRADSGKELGIELLRLLCMLMIVSLHVLSGSGGGGVLTCSEPLSANWYTAWIWESIALQAVNCFGIISGYVQSRKRDLSWSIRKFAQFCIYIFLMNLAVSLICCSVGWSGFTLRGLIYCLPWKSSLWYVQAYLQLILLIPLLNLAIERITIDRKHLLLICAGGLLSLIGPLLFQSDYVLLKNGYSAVWLSALYLIGGILKKGSAEGAFKPRAVKLIVLGVLFCALAFLSKLIPEAVHYNRSGEYSPFGQFFVYISPFVLLTAVCTFLLFSKIKRTAPNWLVLISNASLGVYVIHKHPVINARFVANASNSFALLPTSAMCAKTAFLIFGVFFGSLLASIPITFLCNKISGMIIAPVSKKPEAGRRP